MTGHRLGCVRFLNTTPLIAGLDKTQGVRLMLDSPSRLIDSLAADPASDDAADLALCSLIDAARATFRVSLVPVGMIGCDGPTMTVRLFSKIHPEDIHRLHVDAESHTSVVLAQLVLARRYNARPELVEFDAREMLADPYDEEVDGLIGVGWPDAMLLIGDKVVTGRVDPEGYPHQLDLGESWKELTGLPFVYAVWACRADRADDPAVRDAAVLLDRQLRRNLARMDWVIAEHAAERGWPPELAREYLGRLLRYEVDDRAKQAAAEFLKMAAEEGLVDQTSLRWTTS